MRLKVLRGMTRVRHRYDLFRFATLSLSLLTLTALPLTGLARVDLWGGQHRLWFAPVPLAHGVGGVILAIGALYVITFLSNVAAGRMFCGWGCPVGQLSRFGDTIEAETRGLARVLEHLGAGLFSILFVLSFFAWWADPRVLWLGSRQALLISWGVVLTSALLAFLHGRFWRWEFCKTTCPIGLYYSFVAPADWYGVHFRNAASDCIECDACDKVCPVDLAPRDLKRPVPARGGLSVADAPGRNHCLECGDCIRACEWVVAKKGIPAPLHLGYYRGDQRIVPAPSEQSESGSSQSAA